MPIVSTVHFTEHEIEVTFDDGSSCAVLYTPGNSLLFHSGAEVDDAQLDSLKDEYTQRRCVSGALAYLRHPHTERDLSLYLQKKKFSSSQIERVLAYCRENGYVNDADYASRYIESVIARKAAGELYFVKKLCEKGINHALVKKMVAHFAPRINRIESVLLLAEKKCKAPLTRERLYRYLVSRGYTGDVVREALSAAVQKGMIIQGDNDAES